jgi:hypothetical protein
LLLLPKLKALRTADSTSLAWVDVGSAAASFMFCLNYSELITEAKLSIAAGLLFTLVTNFSIKECLISCQINRKVILSLWQLLLCIVGEDVKCVPWTGPSWGYP